MENDYEMRENNYSITPYVRSKRLHSQLTHMESSGIEREVRRFKYSEKGPWSNNDKKISPLLQLKQSGNDMDIEAIYGTSRQEMYKRYIILKCRAISEKYKNEMANYCQQLKQGDSKFLYRYRECSKDDCINN